MCRQRALAGAVVLWGLALASPVHAQLRTELVASGFPQALAFVQDPSDPAVQVVVQQNGRVRALRNSQVQS